MTLSLRGYVPLPPHTDRDLDHGAVHANSGQVFVAHTANDSVEVIDRECLELERTVPGCPRGSGGTAEITSPIEVSAAGPHGLDLDPRGNRAFVACDAGRQLLYVFLPDNFRAAVYREADIG